MMSDAGVREYARSLGIRESDYSTHQALCAELAFRLWRRYPSWPQSTLSSSSRALTMVPRRRIQPVLVPSPPPSPTWSPPRLSRILGQIRPLACRFVATVDDSTIIAPGGGDIQDQMQRIHFGATFDGVRVGQSPLQGLGVFATRRLEPWEAIPIVGTPLTRADLARLESDDADHYVHTVPDAEGGVDGRPLRSQPWRGVGHRGLALASILNEPPVGSYPNCAFVGGLVIVVDTVAVGDELTVHYGDGYDRTYPVGHKWPRGYASMFLTE